ncbi:MAG: protease inhibitor I42 family protein [Actinomycetota bacterium]
MSRFIRFPVLALIIGFLLLAGACSDVVRLPDCVDCRPVEMGMGETLEIDLGSSRDVSNDPEAYTWIVADTGTMTLVSEDRGTRPEDETEFIGGYSTFVVFRFEPTEPGTTEMRFEFAPTDDTTEEAINSLDITVIVAG